jgi:uncharacterized Tic20 family protein
MHLKETLDFTPSPMLFYLVHLVVVDTISNSVSITDSAFRMISWDTIPFDLILVILSLTLCLSLSLRGFRHEKTKKKRGTYRGGQIDLQSHSFKFNYSDED